MTKARCTVNRPDTRKVSCSSPKLLPRTASCVDKIKHGLHMKGSRPGSGSTVSLKQGIAHPPRLRSKGRSFTETSLFNADRKCTG